MRWKWIATIGVLLIVILIAAVYFYLNTYDYNKFKPLIARMVEEATGRKLNFGGEVNLEIGLMPTLVVTNIAFANVPWGSQSQMIEIERLQAQVQLLPLLLKEVALTQIGLFGVKVLLETGSDARSNWDFLARDSSADSLGALKPVEIDVDRISIENLDFAFRRHKTGSQTQFTLASLVMNRQDTEGAFALKLQADVNGQLVTLSGKTGGVRQLLAHKRFPLELSGSMTNAAIKINGAIDDVLTLQGIDLEAQLIGKNMATLEPFLDIQLPKTKTFDVIAKVKGSKESLKLENFKGNLSGSGFDLAVSGSIGNLIAVSGIDLKLKSSGKDLAEIGASIGEKLPVTDGFTVQGRLTGSAKALSLSEAQGSAHHGGLNLVVDGEIKDLINFSGLDLVVKGSGRDLSGISSIIGKKLPATDTFTIQGRLTGSTKVLSMLDARGSARRGDMHIAVNGGVKDLIDLSGMDLRIQGSGKDLAEIGTIAGKRLPASDKFTFQGRLLGSIRSLSLLEAEGNASRGSLNLIFSGSIKKLLALEDINVKLEVSGKELAEIGSLFGTGLPELGPFDVSGKLSGSTKTILLNDVSAIVDKSDFNGLAKVEFLKPPKITIRLQSSLIDFTALIKNLEKDE